MTDKSELFEHWQSMKRIQKLVMRNFAPEFHALPLDSKRFNKTHGRALFIIETLGTGSMTQVGECLGLEPGSFTPVADFLIDQDLAQRIPDPTDRRKKLLKLTSKGRTLVAELRGVMKDHLNERLAPLSDEEKQKLLDALRVITDVAEKISGGS